MKHPITQEEVITPEAFLQFVEKLGKHGVVTSVSCSLGGYSVTYATPADTTMPDAIKEVGAMLVRASGNHIKGVSS